MVETLKNLLNQKANDLETWYVASGAQVLPSLFKLRPWVDRDLFYGKIKYGTLGEKKKKVVFTVTCPPKNWVGKSGFFFF